MEPRINWKEGELEIVQKHLYGFARTGLRTLVLAQ